MGPVFSFHIDQRSLWVPCPNPFFSKNRCTLHAHPGCGLKLIRKYGFYHFKYATPGQTRQSCFQNSVFKSSFKHSMFPTRGCLSRRGTLSSPSLSTVLYSASSAWRLPWLAEPCLSRRDLKHSSKRVTLSSGHQQRGPGKPIWHFPWTVAYYRNTEVHISPNSRRLLVKIVCFQCT